MESGTIFWHEALPIALACLLTLTFPFLLPPAMRDIAPPLGLAVLFFWRYQQQFPLIGVILCGALLDVMQAMPLGVGISAALLLAASAKKSTSREQHRSESFLRNWFRFSGASLLCLGWIYAFYAVLERQLFPLEAPIIQWILLWASYPLIYQLCFAMMRREG